MKLGNRTRRILLRMCHILAYFAGGVHLVYFETCICDLMSKIIRRGENEEEVNVPSSLKSP